MRFKIVMAAMSTMAALLVSACGSTSGPALSQDYQPADSARIRLFGQNQKPTIMYVEAGQGANVKRIKINVGGGAGDAFGSLLGVVNNQSIGMASTPNTQNLGQMNGILSKAFYREFVIPAGRPVTVHNAFIGLANIHHNKAMGTRTTTSESSCRSPEVTFTPQAGKDYEVATYASGRHCVVQVFEVVGSDGQATLVPIALR